MTAYIFPLLDVFWSLFILACIGLVLFMTIWCFIDNFRRPDHRGWVKAAWTVLIVFVPVFGALIYIGVRAAIAGVET